MLPINSVKKGMTILLDGALHRVVEHQHVKPGKGPAFVRTKLKRLDNGAVIDRTFRSSEKVEQAIVTSKFMEYIYRDGNSLYFMDKDTYEQVPVAMDVAGEGADYLPENCQVGFLMHGDTIVDVELPDTVRVAVTKTEPGVKGDTAQGGSKPATTSTGMVVQVPLFLNEGDEIVVNLKTGKYLKRA
jgi:elongation factor P